GALFERIAEHHWPPPKTPAQLREYLDDSVYNNELIVGQHCLQIHTDNDEIEMAVYAFDDHFRGKHPGLTEYLVLPGWELPDGEKAGGRFRPFGEPGDMPKGSGAGAVYGEICLFMDSCNLSDLGGGGGWRIRGVRIPDLARYLLELPEKVELDGEWPEL